MIKNIIFVTPKINIINYKEESIQKTFQNSNVIKLLPDKQEQYSQPKTKFEKVFRWRLNR